MGFDQNSDLPILQPKKRTTKVNFGIVIGVLLFFLVAGSVLLWFSRHPHEAAPSPAGPSSSR